MVDVRVVGAEGAELCVLEAVDITACTGAEMRCRVSDAVGFPCTVELVLPTGDLIHRGHLREQPAVCAALAECQGSPLEVQCVLQVFTLMGSKGDSGLPSGRYFGSKAGMALERMIKMTEHESPVCYCQRSLHHMDRLDVEKLIASSFAMHLTPMIQQALDVAGSSVDEPHIPSDTSALGEIIYTDVERSATVDLSTCRLWSRKVSSKEDGHPLLSGVNVTASVLWRILFGWEGTPEGDDMNSVDSGPILEVLFLATHPKMRQCMEASRLISELEATARDMGCVAVAVAAVPKQGVCFWSGAGYKTVVGLAEKPSSTDSPDDVFCEPVNELGSFLKRNMVLFTDTPLVAKLL